MKNRTLIRKARSEQRRRMKKAGREIEELFALVVIGELTETEFQKKRVEIWRNAFPPALIEAYDEYRRTGSKPEILISHEQVAGSEAADHLEEESELYALS